ncbi:MAG: hypothetical protein IPQ00_04685 [Chloracidobacterium sp.]|nr:hypothetical protein [Chloracidobacterium sp.]
MIKKSILGTFIAITAIATLVVGTQVLAGVDRSSKNSSDAQLASTTLVFSQVFGGGGGTTGTYSADYVEIKNVSAVPQSLDTLRIMYGSATGQFGSSAGNIYALPNTTLAPGQYFLIQLGTVGGRTSGTVTRRDQYINELGRCKRQNGTCDGGLYGQHLRCYSDTVHPAECEYDRRRCVRCSKQRRRRHVR